MITEPQLTHLETSTCVGHLTLLTYFMPFLSITPISSPWKSGLYFLMKHRQQREFKLSVMKAFGVSGISGACLGKDGTHFGCLSSLDFLLSPYRPTPLCSLSTPKWNLLSNLKVLWIVSTETGWRKIWLKQPLLNLIHSFCSHVPSLTNRICTSRQLSSYLKISFILLIKIF